MYSYVGIQVLVQVCMLEHVRASVLDGIECRYLGLSEQLKIKCRAKRTIFDVQDQQ